MQKKNIIKIAIITVLILLVPLVAMQFSDQVQWGAWDFIFMGALLFLTGLAYVHFVQKGSTKAHRFSIGILVLSAFIFIWVNLSVNVPLLWDGLFILLWGGAILLLRRAILSR